MRIEESLGEDSSCVLSRLDGVGAIFCVVSCGGVDGYLSSSSTSSSSSLSSVSLPSLVSSLTIVLPLFPRLPLVFDFLQFFSMRLLSLREERLASVGAAECSLPFFSLNFVAVASLRFFVQLFLAVVSLSFLAQTVRFEEKNCAEKRPRGCLSLRFSCIPVDVAIL